MDVRFGLLGGQPAIAVGEIRGVVAMSQISWQGPQHYPTCESLHGIGRACSHRASNNSKQVRSSRGWVRPHRWSLKLPTWGCNSPTF